MLKAAGQLFDKLLQMRMFQRIPDEIIAVVIERVQIHSEGSTE